ncbi:MAG TPA: hypothetical protein VGL42_16825 [Opitutaceae bacterium]|jgi:hypothetical protein
MSLAPPSSSAAWPATPSRPHSTSQYWVLPTLAVATLLVAIGGGWDVSWHITIGRDTFWTPAHMCIYLGGATGGLLAGWLAIRATFLEPAEREGGVSLWGGYAPFGAWICIWGATAMLTSAPFDNWWHNAYGLDVKIISPPHVLLFLGTLTLRIGTWVLLLREQNRPSSPRSAPWLYSWVGGLLLGGTLWLFMSESWPTRQHTFKYFNIVAIIAPFFLAAIGRSTKLRWACTFAAGTDMLLHCAITWILPLFPASPHLGPIYNPVTHMVPPAFPQWIILPAIAFDLVRHKLPFDRQRLVLSLVLGLVFCAIFIPAQWWFAIFQLSPSADNWFFVGGRIWPYSSYPGDYWHEFAQGSGLGALQIVRLGVTAMFTAFLGLYFGSFMSRVRR